jgi:hypothetical protein
MQLFLDIILKFTLFKYKIEVKNVYLHFFKIPSIIICL